MQILNSPKFREEYQKISDYIETIEDQNKKTEMKRLLQELVSNVKKIDINHSDIITAGKLSDDTADARKKISEVRKKIFKIIGN
jgi:DNA-binding transcriptional regulator YhcF (GntR family)